MVFFKIKMGKVTKDNSKCCCECTEEIFAIFVGLLGITIAFCEMIRVLMEHDRNSVEIKEVHFKATWPILLQATTLSISVFSLSVIILILILVFSLLLVYGVSWRKKQYVLLWVYMATISLVSTAICYLSDISHIMDYDVTSGSLLMAIAFITIIIFGYFILVVYRFYQELNVEHQFELDTTILKESPSQETIGL